MVYVCSARAQKLLFLKSKRGVVGDFVVIESVWSVSSEAAIGFLLIALCAEGGAVRRVSLKYVFNACVFNCENTFSELEDDLKHGPRTLELLVNRGFRPVNGKKSDQT